MADPKSALDELNSALDQGGMPETAAQATPQTEITDDSQNTQEQIEEAVSIGGRLWTSAEDLDKSYRYLQSEGAKAKKALADREQEFKKYDAPEYRDAIEMAQYFKEHPEIHEKVRDFFQKVVSGDETPKQAIKSSGLSKESPELKQLLEWKASIEGERQQQVQSQMDAELDKEIEILKKDYKLDNEKLTQVLEAANRFNKNLDKTDDWVPLQDIYLMLASKHAWRKSAKGVNEVLPTPRSETIVPTSAARERTPEDDLLKSLDKMGI